MYVWCWGYVWCVCGVYVQWRVCGGVYVWCLLYVVCVRYGGVWGMCGVWCDIVYVMCVGHGICELWGCMLWYMPTHGSQ